MKKEGPYHKHDCRGTNCCQHLGSYEESHYSGQATDVYWVAHEGVLIFRHSSEGNDYITRRLEHLL
jgi:hypothetical protein